MVKNITFSAKEELIQRARLRASAERTTLNDEFRKWLEKYAQRSESIDSFNSLMEHFEYVQPGRAFRRDEMNER